MTKQRLGLVTAWLLLGVVALPAQTGASKQGKLPETAAVLDRYVEVTGGADIYCRFTVEIVETTVTAEDGRSVDVTIFRARDGRMQTVIDAGAASKQSGVTNGVPWEFSEGSGARLLTGKAAERQIALSREFGADTWREQFPGTAVRGVEVIHGRSCYHLSLTRTDGSVLERFYDAKRVHPHFG